MDVRRIQILLVGIVAISALERSAFQAEKIAASQRSQRVANLAVEQSIERSAAIRPSSIPLSTGKIIPKTSFSKMGQSQAGHAK